MTERLLVETEGKCYIVWSLTIRNIGGRCFSGRCGAIGQILRGLCRLRGIEMLEGHAMSFSASTWC
jgi:hypothetical protein